MAMTGPDRARLDALSLWAGFRATGLFDLYIKMFINHRGGGGTMRFDVIASETADPGILSMGNVATTSETLARKGFALLSRLNSIDNEECRRWDSNPHGGNPPEDFKSSASAIPPRRRGADV